MSFVPTPSQDDALIALRRFLLSVLPIGIEVVQSQGNRVPEVRSADFVTMTAGRRERLSTNVTTYADCRFAGSVVGSAMTVTGMRLGLILPGALLLGAGVLDGTTVTAQVSGLPGSVGAYTLSQPQTAPIVGVPLSTGVALIQQPIRFTVQLDVHGPSSGDNVQTVSTLFRDDYAWLWFARGGYAARGIAPLDVGEPRQMAFVNAEQEFEDRWTLDVVFQMNQVVAPPQSFADAVSVQINSPVDGA